MLRSLLVVVFCFAGTSVKAVDRPDIVKKYRTDNSTGTAYAGAIASLMSASKFSPSSPKFRVISSFKREGYNQKSKVDKIIADIKRGKKNNLTPLMNSFPNHGLNHTLTAEFHFRAIAVQMYPKEKYPHLKLPQIYLWRMAGKAIKDGKIHTLRVGNRTLWVHAGVMHMNKFTTVKRWKWLGRYYSPRPTVSYENKGVHSQFYIRYRIIVK